MIPDHSASHERWARVEELYWLALERSPGERDAYVAERCGTDIDLKQQVASLLEAHEPPLEFLATSGVDVAAAMLSAPTDANLVGRHIGPYAVTAWLGAGGMGDVYRAHDARLRRDVALKVLPPLFAHDAARLDAFAREAQALASLSHPHVAAIFGLEQSDNVHALVLELIEGPTLADRLSSGPVPLHEAIAIARQIAEGLEAAHERGIVHRDLKPSNVALGSDGTVKLLDFGIATIWQPDAGAEATAAIAMGTPAYASPEQMAGHITDKRTDIWSFGAVLFELLSGRRALCASAQSGIDSVRSMVDWSALPASTPSAVRDLLARCLTADPRRRLRDIGEARIVLEDSASDPPIDTSAPTRRWRVPAVAATLAIVLAVIAAMLWSRTRELPAPADITRFTHTLPSGQLMDLPAARHVLAVSPDGTQLAYVADRHLYIRSMNTLAVRTVRGVEFDEGVTEPVFSPDGRSLAFWVPADATIKRVDLDGGVPTTVVRTSNPFGLTWTSSGIFYGRGKEGIWRVTQEGAAPEQVVRVADGEEAQGPQLLPGGGQLLFTLASGTSWSRWSEGRVVVQSLTTGQRKVLVDGGADARYVPTGHLVYARDATLFAVPFDAARLEVTGTAVAMVEGVRQGSNRETGASQYSVSSTGTLSYVPGPVVGSEWGPQELLIVDRAGRVQPLKISPGPYRAVRVSPDGARIAVGVDDGREGRIYTYQLSGTLPMQRLTFDGKSYAPVWTPDGERVTFQSNREGDRGIFWQRADGGGTAERLTRADAGESQAPESWSPDGRWLLFSRARGGDVRLWMFSRDDGRIAPFADVHSIFPIDARFSPDGKWVAYSQRDSLGQSAIFVQPFPATGAKYEVPVKGAAATPHKAVWSPSGRELLYIPRLAGFEAVPVEASHALAFGSAAPIPRPFGPGAPSVRALYDVMPDGRFVAMRPIGDLSPIYEAREIQVVINWFEELQKRVPRRQ